MKKLYLAIILLTSIIIGTELEASTITNNYAIKTGSITFKNSSNAVILTLAELGAWASYPIPTGTAYMNIANGANNMSFIVYTTGSSMNIYSNDIITNNATATLLVDFFVIGSIGIINLPAGQSILIPTGVVQFEVASTNMSTIYQIINPITPNTSYIIQNSSSSYAVTAYIPNLINNYSQAATSVNFYNSNPDTTANLISSLSSISASNGSGNVPSNTSFTKLTTTFSGVSSTLTIPTLFPTQHIFGTGSMTNNTTSPVTVTYYGIVNGIANQPLNTPVITIPVQGNIPNIQGCSSITAYASNGTILGLSNTAITPDTSYYINSNGIATTATTLSLTNNYNSNTGTIQFNGSSGTLGTVTEILAWDSVEIPTGTTSILLNDIAGIEGTQFTIIMRYVTATNNNINIYYNETITNTTAYSILANSYSNISSFPIGGYSMSPGQVLPIISGTTFMNIDYNNKKVTAGFIYPTQAAKITYNGTFTLTNYNAQLTNNYTQQASNVVCHNNNPTIADNVIASIANIAPGAAGIISSSSVYTTLDTTFSNGTTQVSSSLTINTVLPTSTIFGTGTMTNNTTSPVTVTYYGTVNGVANQSLNTPVITIPVQGNIPNIQGCSSITVYASDGTTLVIANTPITPATSYYINSNGIGTTPSTVITLTNNYNQQAISVYFFNSSGTPLVGTPISAWNSYTIPTSTVNILVNVLFGHNYWTSYIQPPNNTSMNIYTTSIITNATSNNLSLESYFDSSSNQKGEFTILAGESVPIMTGLTYFAVYNSSGSTLLVPKTSLAANTCYEISYNSGVYSLTSYSPTLTNNYSLSAENLTFFNSNNSSVGDTVSELSPNTSVTISGNTAYITLQELDSTTENVKSTITAPMTFPSQNIFTNYTITNNSGQAIGVTYTGSVNGVPNIPLNSPPILINSDQSSPIVSGALNLSVVDSTGATIDNITNFQMQAGTNYYITFIDEAWYISSNDTTYILTNNFNESISSITFYDDGVPILPATGQVAGWGYTQIPPIATSASFDYIFNNLTSTFTIPASGAAASSNIFENYVLTNNYTAAIDVTLYGTVDAANHPFNVLPISIPVNGSIPILTNATQVSATSTPASPLVATSISSTSSYKITDDTDTLIISAYTPMFINNGQINAQYLTFIQSNYANIPSTAVPSGYYPEFAINTPVEIPGNATFATLNYNGSILTVATPFSQASNLFASNTITNNAEQTISIDFYGTINGMANQPLNSPAIAINAGTSLQMISGASSFFVFAGSTTSSVTSQDSIDADTSYFVNEDTIDGVEEWTITTTVPLSQSTLTNNSSNTGENLKFFSAIDTQIGTTQASVAAFSTVFIPINSSYATITESDSNLVIPLTDTASCNIFNNFVINNNSTETINIYFYGTVNATTSDFLNDPAFVVNTGVSIPIITGSTAVSIVVNGTTVISSSEGPISASSSYYVSNVNGIWTLTESIPQSLVSLTNNYSLDATNLIFYNSSNTALSGETSFPGFSRVPMPILATHATFTDFGSVACNTPLLDTTKPANLFSNYFITNNAGETLSILYTATVNGIADTPLNNPNISCLENLNSPIFTGALTFSIYDSMGTQRVVVDPVAAETSYIINNDWTVTPVTEPQLTNNSTITANDLMFFNAIGAQIGTTQDSFETETATIIPATAVKATIIDMFNGIDSTTLTIPITDTVSSNIFSSNVSTGDLYAITNNATETIDIILYGTINASPDIQLTPVSPTVSILSSQNVPIITGTTTVSIIVSGTTQISHAVINPNTSYFVNNLDGVWTINPYGSIATLTNNYSSDASSLIFYGTVNGVPNTPLSASTSFPSSSSKPIPTTPTAATKATLTDLGTTLTVPINNSNANSTVFYTTAIANNSGMTVNITFYGTVNGVANTALNSTPITKAAGASVPIITGATGITVAQSGGQINNTPIANPSSQSYFISLVDDVWSLEAYAANAILTNNYNQTGTNLNFYNEIEPTTPLPLIQSTTFPAFGIAGIPSTSTSASFVDTFNTVSSTLTFPVIDNVSSNVFVPYSVFNKTSSFIITVNYYGTINGTADTLLNDTPLSIPVGGSIPILASTQYFIVYYPGTTQVIDTRTYVSPLPLVASYDINYTSSTWSITPEIFTLTNNCNLMATGISFYNSSGTLIAPTSYTSIQPWATIPIPATAVTAIAEYTLPDTSVRNISFTLSTQNSSKTFTNNLLINNSRDTVYANFYGTSVNGMQNFLLNNEPIQIQAGDAIPIITSTLNVSVLLDDGFTFISHAPISSTGSYEIGAAPGYSIGTRAIAPTIEESSSALGVLRFLGGSTVEQPTSASVNLYAQNANLFAEFLYVSLYLQVISDSTARAATGIAVNSIINQYGSTYSSQANFNYIANASLMNPDLLIAQQALTRRYSSSAAQITKFFLLLQKRINILAI